MRKQNFKNIDISFSKTLKMFSYFRDYVGRHPGGSALNTCRTLAWLNKNYTLPASINFIGSIGDDSHGESLKKAIHDDGVTAR